MNESSTTKDLLNYIWMIPKDMVLNSVQESLLNLVSKCSLALGEGFDACKSALETKRAESPGHIFLLRILLDSCHLTSESVLILLGNQKIWDSEVLIRAVVEGTVKYVYLCIGSRKEIDEKVSEYADILPQIALLKRHDRIRRFLEVVENPEADEWRAFRDLLLSDTESETIRQLYPKKKRQQLEEKCSFHRLLKALADSGIPELSESLHLFYNYGMSSHILHQDADGVGMIWERNNRPENRRETVELAHGSRILSDMLVMNLLRYAMTCRLCGSPKNNNEAIFSKYNELTKILHDNTLRWGKVEYGTNTNSQLQGE